MLRITLMLVSVLAEAAPPPSNRIAMVDVFHGGEGGYACFRLPSIIELPTGDGSSFAAYADARNKSCSDHAPTDVVFKISRDSGQTWGNLSVLCTDGCTDHDKFYNRSTAQNTPIPVRTHAGIGVSWK